MSAFEWRRLLLVVFGGGAGSGARYLLGHWVTELMQRSFPFGTLAINALGSFCIAVVTFLSVDARVISPDTRLLLATGVLGGFTTYSTFNNDTLLLAQSGNWRAAAFNLFGTVLLCLAAGTGGLAVARWIAALPWVGGAS